MHPKSGDSANSDGACVLVQGERILVTRFFQKLSKVLENPTEEVLDAVIDTFTVDMLDWAPREVCAVGMRIFPHCLRNSCTLGLAAACYSTNALLHQSHRNHRRSR
jgi:hypothetical protein